ncbi:MAG: 1-aminocyclopropane-1-carboxylate deaminase/D-cysteine desulfhydrase [Methyloglobulus sp.]|nr:1-aminocyclopropane-1-carboxylate deaminase/D-cysteine desulfhydrase [Methyloglobulus sp.]
MPSTLNQVNPPLNHPKLIELEHALAQSVLTQITDPFLDNHQISLWIKRDDLLHPIISGNKWRKLKYNLDHALSLGADTLISMGGAYSNHLHALAYIGKTLNLKTIGIIRGERTEPLTPTLLELESWGMELRYISRSEYRHYRDYNHWQDLPGLKPNEYWLPEGGANTLALKGIAELVNEIDIEYDNLCVACGTGATLAGLINAVPKQQSVLGFAALKNASFLTSDVQSLLSGEFHHWEIFHDYHFGGFAKLKPELALFMSEFEQKTSIPLETVYTGKMLYGIYDLIAKGHFGQGERIIALHTGGLQGKRGYA